MVLVDAPSDGVPGHTDDPSAAQALLAGVLSQARRVPRVGRVLLFHPPEAEARLARRALGFRLWPQVGPTAGERYANAFRQAPELGYEGAVVIGVDTPAVPVELVIEAATLLEEHPGVIAPDARGGIALLALQEPQPTIFAGAERPEYQQIVTRARQQLVRLVELAVPQGVKPNGVVESGSAQRNPIG